MKVQNKKYIYLGMEYFLQKLFMVAHFEQVT